MVIERNGFIISNRPKTIGFCKECMADIRTTSLIPGTDIYYCCCCGYHNSEDELVDVIEEGYFL